MEKQNNEKKEIFFILELTEDKMKETIVGLSATLLVLGRLTNIYVIVTDAIAEFHRNKDSLIVKMLDKMSEEL